MSADNVAFLWLERDMNSENNIFPDSMITADEDVDGNEFCIGRALVNKVMIPAKVVPKKNIAYVVNDGEQIAVKKFDILYVKQYKWVPCADGEVPKGAIVGGEVSDDEKIYIERAEHEGVKVVGKVHPKLKKLFIPYGGKEIAYNHYEILVLH
nr:uncharacterized protein LOC111415103 [Onthophagus taurus]